ncbi:fimbrial assembly protein [Niallia sp. NCCP-28]|uniref:fimbrial assembly protein n=1 Tax=Niallia sp. NCCP-28 TaxID=2934712 RepID=UPI002085A277|nr:fimbrial assembly protein [Niallia sp. NCCP-28]GKU81442.1 hypothetical protein NCCP28_08380 [Niallia sp. NCCP-28]
MLVEINLLPKKEAKSSTYVIWIVILVFIAFILAGLFYWQYTKQNKLLETTENSLRLTQKITESEKQKLSAYADSQSAKELETAVSWAENQQIDTVYMMKELSKNLPERGFLEELHLEERQKLNLIVQFDTKSEATYYLNSLLQIDWVEEAVLTNFKSTDFLEDKVSDEIDEAIDTLKKASIEPRYYAQYEVILNVSALKKASEEDKKDNETSIADEEGENSP